MNSRERSISELSLYHITQRGIAKADIFNDDSDRMYFLNCLEKSIEKIFNIHCYCLRDNHIHLLIQADSLKTMAKKLGAIFIRYVKYYNHKYKRDGPLFKGRYRSRAINDWTYFKNCVKYILQNSLEEGVAVHKYRWSSFNDYYSSKNTFVTTALIEKVFKSRVQLYDFCKKRDDIPFIRDSNSRNRTVEQGEAEVKRIYKFIRSRFNVYNPKTLSFDDRVKIAISINQIMPDISTYRISKCIHLDIKTVKKYIHPTPFTE